MRARLRIWGKIIWHGWLVMIAFLLGAPVSLFVLVRGEMLPDGVQRKLHLSSLPSLSLWQWTTFVLILFIFLVLEGAFRVIRRAEEETQRGSRGGQIHPTGGVHTMVLHRQTNPGIRHLEFDAMGTSHWVGEDGKKVKAIRFTAPVEKLVKPEDCPCEVPLKSGWGDRISRFFGPVPRPVIIVHEFGQQGVLIEETHVGQREIAADLYFETPGVPNSE